MSLSHLYGKIEKVTEQSDGTVLVEGIAQAEERDSVGELIRASAMRKAIPKFMEYANVREMHQPIAAGKAIKCFVDDAGVTHLTALVVDAGSIAKVKAGVLQAFSIGGTVLNREPADKSIIDELDVSEISLVDRPCLPKAKFLLCKIDKPAAEVPPVAAPVVPVVKLTAELRKSLFSVGWLAETLSTLDCLAQDAGWEAAYQGKSSDIPARLKAAVGVLADILRDMAAEETAELSGDQIAAAAKPGALQKAEKLAALLRAMCIAAKGTPAAPALPAEEIAKFKTYWDELLAKAAPAKLIEAAPFVDETLAKRANDAETALVKAKTAETEALAKVAALEKEKADSDEAMTKADGAIKALVAEREALRVELTRKGVLRVVPIDKTQDGGNAAEPEKTDEPAAANPVDAMKKVHSGGGAFDPYRLNQGATK